MSEKLENESYVEVFETARLNAFMRIRQLNESAQLAADQSVVGILRPNVSGTVHRVVQHPAAASTNNPMDRSGGSAAS